MKMFKVLKPPLYKTYFIRNSRYPGIRGKENMTAMVEVISKSAILVPRVPRVSLGEQSPVLYNLWDKCHKINLSHSYSV